jgi:hypothetical protein
MWIFVLDAIDLKLNFDVHDIAFVLSDINKGKTWD